MTALIELAILTIVLIFVLTQILLPLCGWKRLFWVFRSPEKKIDQIDAEIEEIKLNLEIAEHERAKQTLKGESENGSDI